MKKVKISGSASACAQTQAESAVKPGGLRCVAGTQASSCMLMKSLTSFSIGAAHASRVYAKKVSGCYNLI